MAKKKYQAADFEGLLENLETCVKQLEQGDLRLKEMLDKYSEGVALVKACEEILTQAETTLSQHSEEEN